MQNNLLFVALANLDPPTYQITYQVGARLRLGLGLGLGLGVTLGGYLTFVHRKFRGCLW